MLSKAHDGRAAAIRRRPPRRARRSRRCTNFFRNQNGHEKPGTGTDAGRGDRGAGAAANGVAASTGIRVRPRGRARHDRWPSRRARLACRDVDRRLRRHGIRRAAGSGAADPREDALGRQPSVHRRRHRRTAALGGDDPPRFAALSGERFRVLHRSRRRQSRILRVRDQRAQHDLGSVPAASLSRRGARAQRLGDPGTDVRGTAGRHAERPVRRRSRVDRRDRGAVVRAGRTGASSRTAARRRSMAHELHARRESAPRRERQVPEDRRAALACLLVGATIRRRHPSSRDLGIRAVRSRGTAVRARSVMAGTALAEGRLRRRARVAQVAQRVGRDPRRARRGRARRRRLAQRADPGHERPLRGVRAERDRRLVHPPGLADLAPMTRAALAAAALLGAVLQPAAPSIPHPRGYVCLFTAVPPAIDGRLDDPAWRDAAWTEDFVDIEGDIRPKPALRTRVKMLWDEANFYIGADLVEPHLWATQREHDSVIFHENDFEFFIDPDGDNHEYYEFEINALNTGWDLLLPRPYKDGGHALDGWEIAGLKTAVHLDGTLNDPSDVDRGWSIEMAVPWKALGELARMPAPPREGDQWRVNFSRVEWPIQPDGRGYRKPAAAVEHNWVWSPQYVIDMHRP